jgi:DNA mismatch endonuclease (patch repair protein)
MKANGKRDTKPEVRLRSALHHLGLRFRKDYPIRPDTGRLIRADIAFPKARIAVFVDGCFWHACPDHGNTPRSNSAYWEPKLRRNVERDHRSDQRLRRADWDVIRVWEHAPPALAASEIAQRLVGRYPQNVPSATRGSGAPG